MRPASIEQPLVFDCRGEKLIGILHPAARQASDTGMLLVVGGPQYRVGSHRQFVLLARDLAAAGIPVFRFDCRGMGDSGGRLSGFEDIADDIRAAIDTLQAALPQVRRLVLWGLCDAATANAFFACGDDRVVGQIALNPWARTSAGEAQVFIRSYYRQRLLSGDFWRKVVAFDFDAGAALRDFVDKLHLSRRTGKVDPGALGDGPLPARLEAAQRAFRGYTLLILSGQDLTAREYENRVRDSAAWRRWMDSGRVEVRRLDEADHTFSRAAWRDQVARWSHDWIRRLAG